MYYELSDKNELSAVSPDWDDAARAFGDPNCLGDKLIGQSIWRFVAGRETKSYLKTLFDAARTSKTSVSTVYRCDSRDQPRLLHLTVAPVADGHLRVSHIDIPTAKISDPPSFLGRILRGQCSQCYALRLDDEWVPDKAGYQLSFASAQTGLCPMCRATAKSAMAAAARAARTRRPPTQKQIAPKQATPNQMDQKQVVPNQTGAK